MIGVIVLPGPTPAMHGLDADRSSALLPLGDRPVLQHIVEYLLSQGITSIELIMEHAPERVEILLGNGDRWGCRFRYHLAGDLERPYRSLKIIEDIRSEPWILVHAEKFPCLELPKTPITRPIFYYGRWFSEENGASRDGTEDTGWGGTAIFPSGLVADTFANQTTQELRLHVEQLRENAAEAATTLRKTGSETSRQMISEWIDVSTPAALLKTQTRLLEKRLDVLMISGTERQPGIWVSRNVFIHPTVELTAPLYIGPNSRLNRGVKIGPNAVISGSCIVDTDTTVQDSLVIAGSYIGEGLELNQAVVDRNLLVNVRLGTSVDILEGFLLGGLEQPRQRNPFKVAVQSVLACALILLFLPVTLLSFLYFSLFRRLSYASTQIVEIPVEESSLSSRRYTLPCFGDDAWSIRRPAGWEAFLRQFVPGLYGVLLGRLSFVGLPPRTPEQIHKLSVEWRSMYLDGRAGLITEASTASTDAGDETQLYLADAYYIVRQSWHYNLRLVGRYFLRLIYPAGLRTE